jgi:hypothetical protein
MEIVLTFGFVLIIIGTSGCLIGGSDLYRTGDSMREMSVVLIGGVTAHYFYGTLEMRSMNLLFRLCPVCAF